MSDNHDLSYLKNKRNRDDNHIYTDNSSLNKSATGSTAAYKGYSSSISNRANVGSESSKPNSRKILEKILDETEKRQLKNSEKEKDYSSHSSREREKDRDKIRSSDKHYKERDYYDTKDKYRSTTNSSYNKSSSERDKERDKDYYKEKEREKEKVQKERDYRIEKNSTIKSTSSSNISTSKTSTSLQANQSLNKNIDKAVNISALGENKNKAYISDSLSQQKNKNEYFIMDEQGRILDDKGNIIQIKPQVHSTLKININKEKEQRVKDLLNSRKIDQFEAKTKGFKFFDPNLENKGNKREKMRINAFKFSEIDNKLNDISLPNSSTSANNILKDNKSLVNFIPEKNSDLKIIIENHAKLSAESGGANQGGHHHRGKYLARANVSNLKQPVKFRAEDLIPDVEWWDTYFLPTGKKSFSPYWYKDDDGNFIHNLPENISLDDFKITDNDFLSEKINVYVQHPVQIKNEYIEKMNKISMPVFLTEKERKRIRRLRRQEKEKDKQERIRLGLEKPEKPKLKFTNFMRILGDEAVQDPSQVEKLVRKAYEERYKKMMLENEKNKLTKEQKAEKIRKKFERDIKKDCKACLFKIADLSNKQFKYKIDKNAQQLYLTGVCITNKRNNIEKIPTFVYVEGGPLALKKYKNLLLRRIKWSNTSINNNNNINNPASSLSNVAGASSDSDYKQNKNISSNSAEKNNLINKNLNVSNNIDNFNLSDDENENENNAEKNPMELRNSKHCMIVWEGTIKKRAFEKWKLMEVTSEIRARKILSDKGMEHYWNFLLSHKYEEES